MNVVDNFVSLALKNNAIKPLDVIYLKNKIYGLIGFINSGETQSDQLDDLLDILISAAIENGKIHDSITEREILETQLTDLLTPLPSYVNEKFWQNYQLSPQTATDYFFNLSKNNNYVKTKAINKNIAFKAVTSYGSLELTINLSKPEKDPKAIAAAAKENSSQKYPQCALCMENEGYLGRLNYPARSNHRIIRIPIGGQTYGMQYSPYAYFNEHAIFLNSQHVPMHIDKRAFNNLLEIVTLFPHYFVGSNADLPIVGGSVLSHDHYQGGRHIFPMMEAKLAKSFSLHGYKDVQCGIVNWPLSTIRLQGKNIDTIANAAEHILNTWINYSDEKVDIIPFTGSIRHHTITPIAYRDHDDYILDLVLRDNHTSDKYPDGVFHPHADVQHIKKENIGLIEVMGRAILPARLKEELSEVQKYLLDQPNSISEIHLAWANQIKKKHNVCLENVSEVLACELGNTFARVLEDAGVFKLNEEGQEAWLRFINVLNK